MELSAESKSPRNYVTGECQSLNKNQGSKHEHFSNQNRRCCVCACVCVVCLRVTWIEQPSTERATLAYFFPCSMRRVVAMVLPSRIVRPWEDSPKPKNGFKSRLFLVCVCMGVWDLWCAKVSTVTHTFDATQNETNSCRNRIHTTSSSPCVCACLA